MERVWLVSPRAIQRSEVELAGKAVLTPQTKKKTKS